jgi:putative ABC transport system permease protein
VAGAGIHLIGTSDEIDRMDLKSKLFAGRFPQKPGEILISNDLFKKMNLKLGDPVTLISSSMYGDMAMYNFTVCGTLHFGITMLDRGMIYADIEDVRMALNMEDAAGEVLGFTIGEPYDNNFAKEMAEDFNAKNPPADMFSATMMSMGEMNGMDFLIAYAENAQAIVISIFVFAMSIVLWNAGLLGGLRRYGEFGLRLAIGENKHETYRSLVGEAVLIGLIGSGIGTFLGLLLAWPMEKYGLNAGDMIKDSTMMMPAVFRASINSTTYYIGFIPGLLSTVIGAMLAGIGIYKRQTANLFKELQA